MDNVSADDLANFPFKNHLGMVLGTCLSWEDSDVHLDDPWDKALKKALGSASWSTALLTPLSAPF